MKDFYKELDSALKTYEEGRPYHPINMDTIANKICWCWKWKKITKEQMEELADRATVIFDENLFIN